MLDFSRRIKGPAIHLRIREPLGQLVVRPQPEVERLLVSLAATLGTGVLGKGFRLFLWLPVRRFISCRCRVGFNAVGVTRTGWWFGF